MNNHGELCIKQLDCVSGGGTISIGSGYLAQNFTRPSSAGSGTTGTPPTQDGSTVKDHASSSMDPNVLNFGGHPK